MGKNSKKSDQPATPATTPTQPMQTIQPAMPGQLEALAQQLGAGFGQQPADMMAYLQQFYKPMSVPDYSPRPAATPSPAASAPTPAPAPVKRDSIGMGNHFNRSRGGGS